MKLLFVCIVLFVAGCASNKELIEQVQELECRTTSLEGYQAGNRERIRFLQHTVDSLCGKLRLEY